MNDLCMIIKNTVKPNFLNIHDRDVFCVGAPCWRWAYHSFVTRELL